MRILKLIPKGAGLLLAFGLIAGTAFANHHGSGSGSGSGSHMDHGSGSGSGSGSGEP